MEYGESVQKVLLRKIQKAEQDLQQLKLDYCRFVFGLGHRACVRANGRVWWVRSVDVTSMAYADDGGFSRPAIHGAPLDEPDNAAAVVDLGTDWVVDKTP
ncbi:hypothetical protein C7H09_04445 [Marinobacter fuscus]|uniref:Uncharacterized protein n=1 Tax=Marinobacter fuscus TaxID=2109942 RepID=A0A2T1KPW1_9GAMM|nr:hypothetical protein [Marinobacter fuscus]PSF12135.1 hypothetical protein C7H09_04445 [Marinobacter fuscus]